MCETERFDLDAHHFVHFEVVKTADLILAKDVPIQGKIVVRVFFS